MSNEERLGSYSSRCGKLPSWHLPQQALEVFKWKGLGSTAITV